jgi:hypothetical protein
MGGNSECIDALKKLFPGVWFVEDHKNMDIKAVPGSTKKTAVVIDAASWLYTSAETLYELVKRSVDRVTAIAKMESVEIVVFAHDRKTPTPKYALKVENPETITTPPGGADAYFKSLYSDAVNAIGRVGVAGLRDDIKENVIVIEKDFATKILSNRLLKEWVANFICRRVFESADIQKDQQLFSIGPNYMKYRMGKHESDFPSKMKVNYLEADYFCSYIANLYASSHDIVVYSIDTDTTLALLLGWDRIKLPVTDQKNRHNISGVRFINNVRVVKSWLRSGTPLQYIDVHELWKAIALRGIELAHYHGVEEPKYVVTSFVAIMTFCGNDYVRKLPGITSNKVLESYHNHFAQLCGPLVKEGATSNEFKLNCEAMLQLVGFAYADKKRKTPDFTNMQKLFETISSEGRDKTSSILSLKEMRVRCANTAWFMKYMLAQQRADLPPVGTERTSNGTSIYGYKLTATEPTRIGWDAVDLEAEVDLSVVGFSN